MLVTLTCQRAPELIRETLTLTELRREAAAALSALAWLRMLGVTQTRSLARASRQT